MGWRRRLVAATGALVLTGAALAGCTDDAPSDGDAAPDGSAPAGGTLRLGLAGPLVVDPTAASPAAPGEMMVVDLLHGGLTDLAEDGRAAPALAVEWSADAEQRTWRFTLDPAARFASGRPLTAADVVASLQRVIEGGDASLAALRLEDVQGFRAYVDGAASEVSGLRAVDATTVEIALDAPLAVLPELLAAPPYGVVDAASVSVAAAAGGEGAEVDPDTMVGALAALDVSGGWAVADAGPGRLLLERLPGTAGRLAEVELRSYPDADAAFDAFEDGAVDWAPVPADRFGYAVEAHGDDHFAPFQAELFLGLRVGAPTLSSEPLRQAIVAAVDGEAVIRGVYPDVADQLRSIVPEGMPGWEGPGGTPPCSACAHDPVRARRLVAEAFPGGNVPPVTIDTEASPPQEALARIVAESLEAVGIPTVVRSRPLAEYQRFLVAGGQEVFTFGWVGGYLSPDAYLTPLFRSTSVDNLVGLASPEVDALLAEARASADPATRAARWAEVERRLLDAAVVVPLAQFRTQVVVADAVQGLEHALDGTVDWAAVGLADRG